jgi:hypothetical protein
MADQGVLFIERIPAFQSAVEVLTCCSAAELKGSQIEIWEDGQLRFSFRHSGA